MGKMVLYIDVDGVVRDLKAQFKKSEYFQGKMPDTYYDKDFSKWWNACMESEEMCKDMYENAPVISGAKEKIDELRNSGKFEDVKFLTANGFHQTAKESTLAFLKKNGLISAPSQVIFVKAGKEKPGFLKKNPGILIDDKINTLTKLEKPSIGIWIRSGFTADTKRFDNWNPDGPKLMFENLADMDLEEI